VLGVLVRFPIGDPVADPEMHDRPLSTRRRRSKFELAGKTNVVTELARTQSEPDNAQLQAYSQLSGSGIDI
jgi:hypothetical protein